MAWPEQLPHQTPSPGHLHSLRTRLKRRTVRGLLALLFIFLMLLALNVRHCSSGPGTESAKVGNRSVGVVIENLAATYHNGTVRLNFDLLLQSAPEDAVILDYQINAIDHSSASANERLMAGRLKITPGEVHKRVLLTFNSKKNSELNLALTGVTGNASLRGANNFYITPTDITPTLPARGANSIVHHTITVSASPGELGNVSGGGRYRNGRIAEVHATPTNGGEFINWTEGATIVTVSADYQFKVTRNLALVAHFQKSPRAETVAIPAPSVATASTTIAQVPVENGGEPAQASSSAQETEGYSGARFIKLDAQGKPLAEQSVAYRIIPWACVLDKNSGLVWEMKSHDAGLHDREWTYTWYNADATTNGGMPGTAGKGKCGNTVAGGCDTEKFVTAVNAAGLCGAKDWRLPTQQELQSIADLDHAKPSIDSEYFPDTRPSWYWTASAVASNKTYSWLIGFYHGDDVWGRKNFPFHVRLVRNDRRSAHPPESSSQVMK